MKRKMSELTKSEKDWLFVYYLDGYNAYTDILAEAHVNMLPCDADLITPFDELTDPLEMIIRIRTRLLENASKIAKLKAV